MKNDVRNHLLDMATIKLMDPENTHICSCIHDAITSWVPYDRSMEYHKEAEKLYTIIDTALGFNHVSLRGWMEENHHELIYQVPPGSRKAYLKDARFRWIEHLRHC